MTISTDQTTTEIRHSITERWLKGKHGPMRYWASEPKQGIPVLFIHGYGALIEHWRPIFRPVANIHTLHALDLYGFGYSNIPRVPRSKDLWADQVAEMIRKVIAEPVVVVGHSMGGMVAAHFTRNYPQLVRSLVLVNSVGMKPDTPPTTTDLMFFNMVRTPLVGELLAGAFSNPWGVRRGLLNAYYRKSAVTPELVELFLGPLRRFGGSQSYLAASRAFSRLFLDIKPGEILAPTLIIWGTEDRSMPPSLATAFKQQMLPQADVQLIPESGHCPFDETPDAFCNVLLPWLEKIQVGNAP